MTVPDETKDQNQAEAAHMDAADGTAPINTNETMAERIARIKRDEQERNAGESGSPTSGLTESSNKSTTADSALRGASDPQHAADRPLNQRAPAPGTDRASEVSDLGQAQTKLSDGTKSGERVRSTTTGLVPESNDVMLGDKSSRKDGPKDTAAVQPGVADLKTDGSRSPHDATSEGGHRQHAAHQQVRAQAADATEAEDQPAFRAEAKSRTI